MGVDGGRGVVTGGAVGCGWAAAGSGFGVAAVVGAFRGVVPRLLVWAIEVVERVIRRIKERAPRAVFIRSSLFLADDRRTVG